MRKKTEALPDGDTVTVTATDILNSDGAPVPMEQAEAPAAVDQVEAPSSQPKPIKPGVRRISLAQARKHHGLA